MSLRRAIRNARRQSGTVLEQVEETGRVRGRGTITVTAIDRDAGTIVVSGPPGPPGDYLHREVRLFDTHEGPVTAGEE